MNYKELKELRAQIKPDSKSMMITKIVTAYVTLNNAVPTIKTFQIHDFEELQDSEKDLYCAMLRKALSGKMGKNLLEMDFAATSEDGQSGPQKVLYALNECQLGNEHMVQNFIEQFVSVASYISGYMITLASCTYQVPVKDKNDEILEEASGSTHRFLLGCINDVALTDIGLFYNPQTEGVEKKIDTDLHVLPNVKDGFMYPVFTDRYTDVSHVLYYTKTPKKPNDIFIEQILGATTPVPCDEEKDNFMSLVAEVAQEEASLDVLSHLYGSVRDVVNDAAKEEGEGEMVTLSKAEVKTLFSSSGISDAKMTQFSAAYDKNVGQQPLKAINIMDTEKLSVKVPDITVTVRGDAAYKVKTRMIDGRQYLTIALDDGLQVNGMDVTK
jgi:hypothetical protein